MNLPDSQPINPTSEPPAPRPAQVVLEFNDVTVHQTEDKTILENISFRLREGETILIRHSHGSDPGIVNVALGLMPASSGQVLFLGETWANRDDADRHLTSRVYQRRGWLTDLTLQENMTLPGLYHSEKQIPQLVKAAEKWAERFGLDQWAREYGVDLIPDIRPIPAAPLNARRLKEYQFVRALFSNPRLILMEEPEEDLNEIDDLIHNLDVARQEFNPAVVWITEHNEVWNHPKMQNVLRYEVEGRKLTRETN